MSAVTNTNAAAGAASAVSNPAPPGGPAALSDDKIAALFYLYLFKDFFDESEKKVMEAGFKHLSSLKAIPLHRTNLDYYGLTKEEFSIENLIVKALKDLGFTGKEIRYEEPCNVECRSSEFEYHGSLGSSAGHHDTSKIIKIGTTNNINIAFKKRVGNLMNSLRDTNTPIISCKVDLNNYKFELECFLNEKSNIFFHATLDAAKCKQAIHQKF